MSVRLSVTRQYCVLTITHILEVFFTIGYPTILVFPYQTGWQYSDGDPVTGASNAREYEQEAQLSQRDRATLLVIEYSDKLLKVIRNDTVE